MHVHHTLDMCWCVSIPRWPCPSAGALTKHSKPFQPPGMQKQIAGTMWILAATGWNQLEKHSLFKENWQNQHPWRAGVNSWTKQSEHSASMVGNLRGTKIKLANTTKRMLCSTCGTLKNLSITSVENVKQARHMFRVMGEPCAGASLAAGLESSGALDSSSLLLLAGLFIMDRTQSAWQTLVLPTSAPRPQQGSGATEKPGSWNASCAARHYAVS